MRSRHEQAARDHLAAQIKQSRRYNALTAGRGWRLPPYWTEDYKRKHRDFVAGWVAFTEAEPLERSPRGGFGDFFGDGWEAALDYCEDHDRESYIRMMEMYALGDDPICRSRGGPFYTRITRWWGWDESGDGRKKVWAGPSNMPRDPMDGAVLMAVCSIRGAATRWAIRAREGRTDVQLRHDLDRELGGVGGDDIPYPDPYREEAMKAGDRKHYGMWLRYTANGPDGHKISPGYGKTTQVRVESWNLPHDDKRKKIGVWKGDKLVGAVRRIFKIGMPATAEPIFVEEQGVML